MLISALGRKCEPAHEVGKHSKAHSAVLASLVSGVTCGLHLMNFNLNDGWLLLSGSLKSHLSGSLSKGSHRFSLIVLWSPREPAVLQEENVDLPGRCLRKVDLGPLRIETSLGSSTIPDPSASLLEGIWNLEGWESTHLDQEVSVWWGIRIRRWPREDYFLLLFLFFFLSMVKMFGLFCSGGIVHVISGESLFKLAMPGWHLVSLASLLMFWSMCTHSRMCSRVFNNLVF